jgi:hypothetical protein
MWRDEWWLSPRAPRPILTDMTRRLAPFVMLLTLIGSLLVLPGSAAAGAHTGARVAPDYQPDGWIKLCGLSTGCKVGPPPPHPWRGNDVYNTTGKHQTVSVRMEDGEGARFFIQLQNDGAQADTLTVQGCKGTPRFVVNSVLIGKHTRPDWHATNITAKFKKGTATFDFPPSSAGKKTVFTLNIIAPTTAEGITYRCPVTITSSGDPSAKDTLIAKMTTY